MIGLIGHIAGVFWLGCDGIAIGVDVGSLLGPREAVIESRDKRLIYHSNDRKRLKYHQKD
jgi:hypothetical protein